MDDNIFYFKSISKYFFGIRALENVNINLKKGSVLGLIGENGAGKSTLMNIMGGVLQPEKGELGLSGQPYKPESPRDAAEKGIQFIHQELNLFANLSVAENIFIDHFPSALGGNLIKKREMNSRTEKILEMIGLDVNPQTIVENLSPGEKQLVEIAKALNSNASIYLFDEPTTSLTSNETEKLFEIINDLRLQGKSVIYISHILEDVKNLADELVVLRDGEVVGGGPIEDFSIQKMISMMVGREIDQIYPEKKHEATDEVLLDVAGVSQQGLVKDISFSVQRGEVLGVFGLMGSGRTEFLRMLFGVDNYSSGKISFKGKPLKKRSPDTCIKNGIAFVTEDRREEGLLMNVEIAENLGLVSLDKYVSRFLKLVQLKILHQDADKIAKSLKLKASDIKKQPARSLSGGNQQKVVIGKWLMKDVELLIMDEPTRGIDVGAKYEVYSIINRIASEGSGVLVVSSEVEELIGICDRIIVMNRGEVIKTISKKDFNKEHIMAAAFRQTDEVMVC